MSPSSESPNGTDASANDHCISSENEPTAELGSPDASARAYPGRVRGQRLEITPADLTMYSAITGRAPSSEERERALNWSEEDPMHEHISGIVPTAGHASAVLPVHALRPWHPGALSLRLREIWFNGLTIRVNRPQISNWLRRFSLALQQGRRRVRQPSR